MTRPEEVHVPVNMQTFLSSGELPDHPSAVVDPPCHIVGEFFTADLNDLVARRDFILQLRRVARKAARDPSVTLQDGVGGHEVLIANGMLTIEAPYRDEGASCSITREAFIPLLTQWYDFLRANAD